MTPGFKYMNRKRMPGYCLKLIENRGEPEEEIPGKDKLKIPKIDIDDGDSQGDTQVIQLNHEKNSVFRRARSDPGLPAIEG
jgi:hypothetical protein